MSIVYKIRNSKGLFSTGGSKPRFVKDGKVWSKLSHVKLHLREFHPKARKFKFNNDEYNLDYEKYEATKNKIPSDWEIVELEENGKSYSARGIFGEEL